MIVASFPSPTLGLAQSSAEVDGVTGDASQNSEFCDLLATSLAAAGNSTTADAPNMVNSAAIPGSGEEHEPNANKDENKSAVELANGLMFAAPLWFQTAQPSPQPVQSQPADKLSVESGDSRQPVGSSAVIALAQLGSTTSETLNGLPIIQNGVAGLTVAPNESEVERTATLAAQSKIRQNSADSDQPLSMQEPVKTAVAKRSLSDSLSEMTDELSDDASGVAEPNQTQPFAINSAAQASVKPEAAFHSAEPATPTPEAVEKNLPAQDLAKNQHADMTAPVVAATTTAQEPATMATAHGATDAIDLRVGKVRRGEISRSTKSEKQIESSDPTDAVSTVASKPAMHDEAPLGQAMFGEHEGGAAVGEKNGQNGGANSGRQPEAFERPISAAFHVGSTSLSAENSKDGQISTIPWQPVVERVAGEIAGHLRIGKQEAVIQLDPPELGKIRIDLRIDGDKIEARISAVEHSARTLLETHLPELRHALEVGQVHGADVNIDNRSWSGSSGSEWSQGSQEAFQHGGQRGNRQEGALADTFNDSVAPAQLEGAGDGQDRISMWA